MERLLSAHDVAAQFGIRVGTVYAWVSRGQIPCVRIRRALRFSPQQLAAWIEHQNFEATSVIDNRMDPAPVDARIPTLAATHGLRPRDAVRVDLATDLVRPESDAAK